MGSEAYRIRRSKLSDRQQLYEEFRVIHMQKAADKTEKTQADQAYQLMFDIARGWLKDKDPHDVAVRSGAVYDEKAEELQLSMMGKELRISWPSCMVSPRPENWQVLVLLHYLNLADGTPAAGERFAFRDMKDGLIRGGKFEFTADRTLQRIIKGKTAEQILDACALLGGEAAEGNGDVNVCLAFLPHLPFYLSFWMEDDEFPASGRLYPDRCIDHYLTIEDAVTVGEIILRNLEAKFHEIL